MTVSRKRLRFTLGLFITAAVAGGVAWQFETIRDRIAYRIVPATEMRVVRSTLIGREGETRPRLVRVKRFQWMDGLPLERLTNRCAWCDDGRHDLCSPKTVVEVGNTYRFGVHFECHCESGLHIDRCHRCQIGDHARCRRWSGGDCGCSHRMHDGH